MSYNTRRFPRFDAAGGYFYEKIQEMFQEMGYEAAYSEQGDQARFSVRPEANAPWLDLDIAPGPETDFGQGVLLPTAGGGAHVISPEIYVPEKGDPYMYSPQQVLGNYIQAAFNRPALGSKNLRGALYKSFNEPNPTFHTAGGLAHVGPTHRVGAIRDFARRVSIQSDAGLYPDEILSRIYNMKSSAAASTDLDDWFFLNKYAAFKDVGGGGPIRLRNVLDIVQMFGEHGAQDAVYMGAGPDPSKVLKHRNVAYNYGLRNQADVLTYSASGGIREAEPQLIQSMDTQAGYRLANAIFPGEEDPRASLVIPRTLHVPETPYSGAAMTFGNQFPGIYGFGYASKVPGLDLSVSNFATLPKARFEFGIYQQENLKNVGMETLRGLGISQRRSEAILAHREAGGSLGSVSDITSIPGVGRATAKRLMAWEESGGGWVKTRELQDAIIRANETATIGLIRHEDRVEPITYRSPGRETYFTGTPKLVLPRAISRSTGEAGSLMDENIQDLYEQNTAFARNYMRTMQENFPGEVAATGVSKAQLILNDHFMVGLSGKGDYKTTFAVSPEPEEGYRPTVNIGGREVPVNATVGNIKNLDSVFGRMFAALPSGKQKQFATDVLGQETSDAIGLGQPFQAVFEKMTVGYNRARGTRYTTPEFMHEFRQEYIQAARARPEHFLEQYEMGVGDDIWAPFGYFSGVEKQAFEEATRRKLRSQNPNITPEQIQSKLADTWQFNQYKDTDFYEARFKAPAMYGPMLFDPTPEYLTKSPRLTQEEMASISFNFPGIAQAYNLGVDAESGTVSPHVAGWKAMGEIYRYRTSGTSGIMMGEDQRTNVSLKQIGRIREIAGDEPNLEQLQEAIEEVIPGAGDFLTSEKTGLTLPSPNIISDISTTNIGVQEDAEAVQQWAREYQRIFFEGMTRGAAPKTKAGKFFSQLQSMAESKSGAMYRHTASTYLDEMDKPGAVGGRYGLQTGLGAQEIMMQSPVLQRVGRLSHRTLREMERVGEGMIGLLNRSPTTSRIRGVQATEIFTPEILGNRGMIFPRAPEITRTGEVRLGNPLMSGMAFHMGLPGADFLGDWDADPALAVALGLRKDNPELAKLRLNEGYESWQTWSDSMMRQTIGEIGGIPGGKYNILSATAGDIMSAAEDPQAWFNKKGYFKTTNPDEVWDIGAKGLQAGIGMGTSYNLSRWMRSAATARGFGEEAIGLGSSGFEGLYQRYIDKEAYGTPIETLFNTAVFGQANAAQGGLELRYRWGTLLGDLGRQATDVPKKDLLDTLMGETIKSNIHPISRAFMFSRNEPEFMRARELINADSSPASVARAINEIVNSEGYDVTESVLGTGLFSSATAKLHGLLGKPSTQSFDPATQILYNQRSNTLRRLRKNPAYSVPWREESYHPAELQNAPEIFETIGAYQTVAPEGGPPTLEQSAALTRLGTDAPIVRASATRWGGIDAISNIAIAQAMGQQRTGNRTVDRARARARALGQGPTRESIHNVLRDTFDYDDNGNVIPPIPPTNVGGAAAADDDDGGGGNRGGGNNINIEGLGEILTSAIVEGLSGSKVNLQMTSRQPAFQRKAIVGKGLIAASKWGFQASMFRAELDQAMEAAGVEGELFGDRLYNYINQFPEEAQAFVDVRRGSDMKEITKAGRFLSASIATSRIPHSTTPQQAEALERLQAGNTAGTSMAEDLLLPGQLESFFSEKTKRRSKYNLEPGTDAFDRFMEKTDEVSDHLERFAEKVQEGKTSFQDLVKIAEDGQKAALERRMGLVPSNLVGSLTRMEGYAALGEAGVEGVQQEAQFQDQLLRGYLSDANQLERLNQTGWQKAGGFARRMLGGWGMFYMGHLAKLGMGQFQQGYQESQAFQQAANQQAISMFGAGEVSPFVSPEMIYQQAMARQGGNVFGTLRNMTTQGGMQDIWGSALTGVGMGALGLYLGGNLQQAGFMPKAANWLMSGSGMGTLASLGAVGAFALTQYSYAENYDQSQIQAAAFGGSGRGFAKYIRGIGPTLSDMIGGQEGTTFFEGTNYLERAARSALAGGIPINQAGTDRASPGEMARIAQVVAQTEGTAMEGLPIEMQNSLMLMNLRGGYGYTGDQLAKLGFTMQAGTPIEQVAQQQQWLTGQLASSQGQFQTMMDQLVNVSPEQLNRLAQGGALAAQLPGMQRSIQRLAGWRQQDRGTTAMQMADALSLVAGGPNEDLFQVAWGNYATASALGMNVPTPRISDYDRDIEYSPDDIYTMGAMENRRATRNQVFARGQQLELSYGASDALARYAGRGLEEGRMITGVMNLDPLWIQRLAMEGAGANFNALANMDINAAGNLTGLSWGTTSLARGNVSSDIMGQRILGGLAGSGAGQAAIAGGMRGLQDWYVAQQMEQQEAQIGIQGARLALQREYQPQFWAVQDQQLALSRRQQAWNFEYQGQMFDIQGQQFNERMGFQRQQQLQRQQWTMQDWGYQDLTRNMQWGWKQEDFEENVRFMSGRQRKLAERQMERETIMFGLEGDQISTQRDRQKRIWQEQEEQYEMTMRHQREVRDLQEVNMEKQKEFYDEGQELQDRMTKLQREYWEKNMQLSEQALGLQQEQLDKSREYQDVMKLLNRAQEDYYGQWKLAQAAAEETVTTLLNGLYELLGLDPSILDNAANNTQGFSSSWNTSSFIPVSSGPNGGATNIDVSIGDQHLASFIIASLENNLKVAV